MPRPTNSNPDEKWMARAVLLARKGIGSTSPNPRVGAVVVRGGRAVGEGYHRRAGEGHAEVIALRAAGARARGADLYVTLEPCSTAGRTPACTDTIVSAGIRRVIFGAADPNPRNHSKAARLLRSKGVRVDAGVLEADCEALNRPFSSWMTRGRAWVTLKLAASLDGRIATRTGESKWITSPASREIVQRLRFEADAVLVGAGTVRHDNPRLDVRGSHKKKILKIVLGSRAAVPARARLLESGDPVWIISPKPGQKKADLKGLVRELGRQGYLHLLVEGGGETAASFIEAGLVDEVYWFTAPKIIGGRAAVPSVGGTGVARLSQTLDLRDLTLKRIGPDFLFHGFTAGGARTEVRPPSKRRM
jgi:diaminohydroxyphosphoribosylaminopyrimidine deaminase/5-amino-6-(5-phosphoribosylamino)uracil reductase